MKSDKLGKGSSETPKLHNLIAFSKHVMRKRIGNQLPPRDIVIQAIKQAILMEKQGADIIDIGGESTRPGAKKISVNEEIDRIIPIIEEIIEKINIPI